jgi:hypothetical protein
LVREGAGTVIGHAGRLSAIRGGSMSAVNMELVRRQFEEFFNRRT